MSLSSKPARISHEGRIVLLAFLAGLPGSAIALYMLWSGGYKAQYELTFTTLIVCVWLGFAFAVRERVVFPLQTLSNLLGPLREGLLGQTAEALNLATCLEGPEQTTLQASFPGGAGRFGVRRTRVRERGLPLELVVISDLTQRSEERRVGKAGR